MKILSFVLFLWLTTTLSYGQLDAVVGAATKQIPQLVTMPDVEANTEVLVKMQTQMAATQTRMEVAQIALENMMKVGDWADKLVTVQRLISLIENTICFSSNLNVKVGYYSSNCIYQFHWNMQLVRLNCAVDQLSLIIANGIQMTTGERLAGVDRAVQDFHLAQSGLQNLNSVLDRRLMESARKTEAKKTISYLIKVHR